MLAWLDDGGCFFRLRLRLSDERLPRAWIARQLRLEIGALARTLQDLAGARRLGLLTPQGIAICRAIERRVEELRLGALKPQA